EWLFSCTGFQGETSGSERCRIPSPKGERLIDGHRFKSAVDINIQTAASFRRERRGLRIAKKLFTSRLLSALLDLGLVAYPCVLALMFLRLFTLALLVLADLAVDAAPVLNSDQNRMEETRKEHEEALKTYRELARKEPETYLPKVAQTLNNLGIVDSAQNRAKEARRAFTEALKIYRELAQKEQETYLPYVATTLNNLGVLDHAQNRLEEARKALEETLKL